MGERLGGRDKSKPPKDITKEKQSPKVPGMHRIAPGLYLRVRHSGGAFRCLRYTNVGNATEMGLGSLESLSLAEAKVKAASRFGSDSKSMASSRYRRRKNGKRNYVPGRREGSHRRKVP